MMTPFDSNSIPSKTELFNKRTLFIFSSCHSFSCDNLEFRKIYHDLCNNNDDNNNSINNYDNNMKNEKKQYITDQVKKKIDDKKTD